MYLYELAGENLELARAEVEGFLGSQDEKPHAPRHGRLCVSRQEPGQLRRLALVHRVSKLLESFDAENIDLGTGVECSYKVEDRTGGQIDLEEKVGEKVGTGAAKVDLENPERVLNIYRLGDRFVLAEEVIEIDRGLFEKRSNQERPFSAPVSLDPVMARVMVNLSGVPAGEYVLDPFCGTGGILVEAGLCGVGVIGSDIEERMVSGTGENLEEYGILNYSLQVSDFREVPEMLDREPHSIVTDLPYGRSSRVEGELEEFLEVVEETGAERAVFSYNKPEFNGLEAEHEVYVHRSLSRYIYVYESS